MFASPAPPRPLLAVAGALLRCLFSPLSISISLCFSFSAEVDLQLWIFCFISSCSKPDLGGAWCWGVAKGWLPARRVCFRSWLWNLCPEVFPFSWWLLLRTWWGVRRRVACLGSTSSSSWRVAAVVVCSRPARDMGSSIYGLSPPSFVSAGGLRWYHVECPWEWVFLLFGWPWWRRVIVVSLFVCVFEYTQCV